MNLKTDAKRREEIAERERVATSEPITRTCYDHGGGRAFRETKNSDDRHLVLSCYDKANRDFYFHARADVPDLLRDLEATLAEVARAQEKLDSCDHELANAKGACSYLQSELEGSNDCLDMVRKKLVALGCAHGAEKHESTPPMFYAGWIDCVVAHALAQAAGKEGT